ncbi:F-box domain [Dillenia turbinata]|uniref:F-box protein n=1 Tax=Dillenia turbinata TaxID=194707 RepID=A0AAN8VR00_9MAGN
MANDPLHARDSISFSDFPEDVQLCVLSFLTPSEIAAFSCTSKRFVSLCQSESKLWYSLCDRRFNSKTHIKKWGSGRINFKLLYKTLSYYENLIGFWRRSGCVRASNGVVSLPPLIFFEWGSSFISGSRVSPSKDGSFSVVKSPFLWLGLNPDGESVNLLDPDCKFEFLGDFERLGVPENDLVPVNVNFMGNTHIVVEENLSFACSSNSGSPEPKRIGFHRSSSSSNVRIEDFSVAEDGISVVDTVSPGSLPDRWMEEMYQHFANRTSPGADRVSRRQRRREKERQGRRKWEPEHFVKIVNCSPTASRPLQGLWKGICEDMNLDFYLVAYDDIGGVACRRVGDSSPFSGYSPVFWTSDATFVEPPFSPDEEYLYGSRIHLQPPAPVNCPLGRVRVTDSEEVSRILLINSSYDLIIPDLAGTTANPWHAEGRIWQYHNGTFGFGFLRNNFIIDLKHIAENGRLLDIMEVSGH